MLLLLSLLSLSLSLSLLSLFVLLLPSASLFPIQILQIHNYSSSLCLFEFWNSAFCPSHLISFGEVAFNDGNE